VRTSVCLPSFIQQGHEFSGTLVIALDFNAHQRMLCSIVRHCALDCFGEGRGGHQGSPLADAFLTLAGLPDGMLYLCLSRVTCHSSVYLEAIGDWPIVYKLIGLDETALRSVWLATVLGAADWPV
jgi:hypothetical protein